MQDDFSFMIKLFIFIVISSNLKVKGHMFDFFFFAPESKYQYSAQRYSIMGREPPSGNIKASGVLRSQSAFLFPLFDSLNKA